MLKRFLKVTLVVVACLLMLISFLPMIVSISKVNQFLLSCVNSRIGGKVHAQEIRLGWSDGISVKGLKLEDPQGRNVALFKNISLDMALLSLIHAPAVEGRIEVDSPKITLIDDKNNGQFSIEQVFSKPTNEKQIPTTDSPKSQLTLSELHLAVDIHPQGQAKITLTCQVENDDAGSVEQGSVNLTATAQNFADLEKAYKSALAHISSGGSASVVALDCYIADFPLKAAVPFARIFDPALANLMLPALGNKVNAKISHTLHGDELGLSVAVDTPRLTTKLKASVKENTFTIKDEGSLNWNIEPQVLKALSQSYPQYIPADINQESATTLIATVKPDSGTLGADGKMPIALAWNLDSPVVLSSSTLKDPLSCKMSGTITTASMQERIESRTQIELTSANNTSSIDATCLLNTPFFNPETTTTIAINGPVASQLEQFIQPPLPLATLLGKSTKINATCKTTSKTKSGDITLQSDALDATLNFDAVEDKTNQFVVTTNATADLAKASPLYRTLGGQSIAFHAKVPLSIDDGKVTLTDAKASLTSQTLTANVEKISGTITPDFQLQSSKQIAITYNLTPAATQYLLPNNNLVLTENAIANVVIEPFQASLPLSQNSHPITGKITVAPVAITIAKHPHAPMTLSLPFALNLSKNEASGKLAVESSQTSLQTTIVARLEKPSEYTQLPPISVALEGKMNAFPVDLVAAITQNPELTELLGKKLTGTWKLSADNSLSSQPLALTLKGDGLELQTNLQLASELSGKDAATINYTVTPKRLEALQNWLKLAQSEKQKEIQLQEPVNVSLHVKKIKLPLEPFVQKEKPLVLAAFLDHLTVVANLTVDQINLSQKNKHPISVAPLQIEAELKGKTRLVEFTCESANTADKTTAQISIKGSANNLWNEKSFQVDNARILLDTKIQNLPLDIFYSITAKEQTADDLIAVLGHKLDANINAQITDLDEGSFHGVIQSPRLKSEVYCLLKEGTLTLEKPVTAEYTLTPEAGEVLLKDVNPLLATASSSDHPITLAIDSEGFSIPLKPFALKNIHIKDLKVDPGLLKCKNKGMLGLLIKLLKVDVSKSKDVNLWFTPIYIEMKDGVIHCKRSDALLADEFPLATWGKIDLVNDKIDMTLGLSGTAVSMAFGIAKLDPGHMVQIPIRGTTKSPKIDTALVTTKIAATKLMLARSPTTSLIGGLLQVATTIIEKDPPVPASTTHPLPWANKVPTSYPKSKR